MFVPKLFSSTGSEIECPKFIGTSFEDLKANKDYNDKFDFNYEWDYNSEYDYGIIYDQSQTPGKKLKKGAEIVWGNRPKRCQMFTAKPSRRLFPN